MNAELVVLRLVHVLCGIFWVGSGVFTAFFLMPTLIGNPAHMAPVMAGLQQRRLFTVLPVVALLTIASGGRLMWLVSGASSTGYLSTPTGQTFAVSGGAAILAFLSSLLVGRPAFAKAGRLSATLNSIQDAAVRERVTAQIARLRRTSGLTGNIAMALLLLAAAGMSVARYVS